MLPNGHWKADPQAIGLFNELTVQHGTLVVYATRRNLDLTEKAIEEYGVRHPDILCGDVGTTIRSYADSTKSSSTASTRRTARAYSTSYPPARQSRPPLSMWRRPTAAPRARSCSAPSAHH